MEKVGVRIFFVKYIWRLGFLEKEKGWCEEKIIRGGIKGNDFVGV